MSGHIRKRGERSWEIKFDLGIDPVTGKRKIRYASVKGTKRDAQAKLTELLSEHARGVLVDPTKETLSAFMDRWDRDWATHNVSPKTAERYRQLIAHQVKPHLGAMPVQRIKPIHLNALYSKLLQSGGVDGGPLAPLTVGHVHRLLRRVFGHAVAWGVIAANPAASVSPPRVAQTEIEIISESEIRIVLDALRVRNPVLYTIAALALASGARRGELLALRWKDIDLDGGKLRIERSLEQTRTGLAFKSPKTKHGRRAVTIPPSTVADLRVHWKATQEQRLALGLGRSAPDDLVFTTLEGSPRKPNTLSSDWMRASKIIGRRISLHALRHTSASSLIAAGVDILTISRRLGHADAKTTLSVYAHLYGNADDNAALVASKCLRGSTHRRRVMLVNCASVRWQSGGNFHFATGSSPRP
jgi:integrase